MNKNMKKLVLIPLFLLLTQNAQAFEKLSALNLLTEEKITISLNDFGSKGAVFVFLSAKCPCSDSHVPEVKKLSGMYPDFKFYVVHSNADEAKDLTMQYFKNLQLPFLVLKDQKSILADRFKAYKTPHVFVLNSQGEILYQGGVSDSSKLYQAKEFYLAQVLEDLQAGKKARFSEKRTLGCVIQREGEANVW